MTYGVRATGTMRPHPGPLHTSHTHRGLWLASWPSVGIGGAGCFMTPQDTRERQVSKGALYDAASSVDKRGRNAFAL